MKAQRKQQVRNRVHLELVVGISFVRHPHLHNNSSHTASFPVMSQRSAMQLATFALCWSPSRVWNLSRQPTAWLCPRNQKRGLSSALQHRLAHPMARQNHTIHTLNSSAFPDPPNSAESQRQMASQTGGEEQPKLKLYTSTEAENGLPVIREEDLIEDFVRGSGSGGQKVNKTSNCVVSYQPS